MTPIGRLTLGCRNRAAIATRLPWRIAGSLPIAAIALLASGCTSGRLLTFPYDPAGRNPSSLNSAYADRSPHLAGRYITFVSDRNGSDDVYLYDIRDRRLVELPGLNSLDAIADRPSVSDDGNWIAFAATRRGRTALYLYDRRNRQLRAIAEDLNATIRNPTLSADGNRIAVEVERNGQWDVVLYNRNGTPVNLP